MYPLFSDGRITWYVNDYEGRNTSGLGAYWGFLIGALDRRNIVQPHHAPLDTSSRSAGQNSDESMQEENASKSNDEEKSQSSIFTLVSAISSKSNEQQMPPNSMPNKTVVNDSTPNGQQMPPNSMPNIQIAPTRVSVIVPNIVQPAHQPPPALMPADQNAISWADDMNGESYFMSHK